MQYAEEQDKMSGIQTLKIFQNGISRKYFLQLTPPTEEDNRSCQSRIIDAVKQHPDQREDPSGISFSLPAMRSFYPLCEDAEWNITVSMYWNGQQWIICKIEPGDTSNEHYGIAIDLGSTTVAGQLLNCSTGKVLAEASTFNLQIKFGTNILDRIFYSKDHTEHLNEIREAAAASITEVAEKLGKLANVPAQSCISMTISGNTTMIHFLLGLDAFCVFSSPYALRVSEPGFFTGSELGVPAQSVYCFPSVFNYVGGDTVSGIIAAELYKREEISAFFDIGTNGELVIGNKDFLLCGAGAAGPALEGAVVKTGMRAEAGAVDKVKICSGHFENHVIGDNDARGICGSGIVDMIAQLFLNGWIDLRGTFIPEKTPLIREVNEELAIEYAPGLFFFQSDINEFLLTKAAAYTMVDYMLSETGLHPEDLDRFYVSGAFGKYVSKESAVTLGMYPDIDRERIINAGNTSLEGAAKLLLDKRLLNDIEVISEKMTYIQFGAVDNFLHMMQAAQCIPHLNASRFPSVPQPRLRLI